ncbi:L,D-transpeptidase family protein [Ancylobacter sp. SL191]|uniref:L,D-transpeptidase family protein n=1 Tax=Ancylobacter sp. SL191 TaxID=2995166 RepID=UPI00226DC263|nr:L,D-transpeptidase family protein [Ancylobacter sp. SL191]WAC28392.1 L,D-transpeptidase family protein [Ancylobacter sp. SL191]
MNKKALRRENLSKSTSKTRAIRVVPRPGAPTRGWLLVGAIRIPVALGRSGIHALKREGDGVTPAGIWHAREVRYRADHGMRPSTALPVRRTRPEDGWCDDPADGRYNRPVRLPFAASHEEMWRTDGLYDLVVVLDHNERPRKTRGGSAVFLHLARPGFEPTAGCVAFRRRDLRWLLARITPRTAIKVG